MNRLSIVILTLILITQLLAKQTEEKQVSKAKLTNSNLSTNAFFEEYKAPQSDKNFSSFGQFIKTIFILVVIIGIFIGVAKYFDKKKILPYNGQLIKILSSYPFGSNKFIHIVEIAGDFFVLGATEHNINLITKIETKEAIDLIKLKSSASIVPISFTDRLFAYMRSNKSVLKKQNTNSESLTNIKEKLKTLNRGRKK